MLKNIPESSKVHRMISGVEAQIKPKKRIRQGSTRLFFKQLKEKSILENIEIFHTLMTLRKLSFGLNYFHF